MRRRHGCRWRIPEIGQGTLVQVRASSHDEAQASPFPNCCWGGLPAFIFNISTHVVLDERITTMLNQSSYQPDRQMYITDSKCDASAASDFWETGDNPRFRRRGSRRRPWRRKLSLKTNRWLFLWFLVFLPVLYVALVAFLHSWGIVAIGVYFVLGKIFLAVLGKMPPPPAGEDDRSNYTLQA